MHFQSEPSTLRIFSCFFLHFLFIKSLEWSTESLKSGRGMEAKAVVDIDTTPSVVTSSPGPGPEGQRQGQGDVEGLIQKIEELTTRTCAICPKPGHNHCQKCCKVNYCSREHQVQDWKAHRPHCFPFETRVIKINGEEGRYMFATRDLAQGDKIHKENAFLQGPRLNDTELGGALCLGCSLKILPKDLHEIGACSKCMWNMCGPNCEKTQMHAEFECQLFQKLGVTQNRVNFPDAVIFYDTLTVLRILLLKEKDKAKFDLIMSQSFTPADMQSQYSTDTSIAFLRKTCMMTETDFSDDELNHLFRVVRANCIAVCEVSPGQPSNIAMSLFFENTEVYAPNCVPNMRWAIGVADNVTGTFSIRTAATVPIKKGDMLIGEFTHCLTGTLIRRKVIHDQFFHICKCERCRDPSELGTYVSAVKCPELDCKDGYCIQKDPLIPTSDFVCDKCKYVLSREKVISSTIALTVDLDKVCQTSEASDDGEIIRNLEQVILDIEKQLIDLRGSILHPNHFLIIKTAYCLCSHFMNFAGDVGPRNVKKDLAERVVEYSKACLKVANVLLPGESRMRGRLLYSLQLALGITILGPINDKIAAKKLTETVRRYRLKSLEKLLSIQEECEKILKFEPFGTEESLLLAILKEQIQESHDVINTLKGKKQQK